jgi:hypothetical protein
LFFYTDTPDVFCALNEVGCKAIAVERELRAAGAALDVEYTKDAQDGERVAHDAVLSGRRRVLVVGGDGSVHDVVNGIMSAGSLHTEVTLAVAPLGTANDWRDRWAWICRRESWQRRSRQARRCSTTSA